MDKPSGRKTITRINERITSEFRIHTCQSHLA